MQYHVQGIHRGKNQLPRCSRLTEEQLLFREQAFYMTETATMLCISFLSHISTP